MILHDIPREVSSSYMWVTGVRCPVCQYPGDGKSHHNCAAQFFGLPDRVPSIYGGGSTTRSVWYCTCTSCSGPLIHHYFKSGGSSDTICDGCMAGICPSRPQ